MVRSESCGGADEGAVILMENETKLLDVEEMDDEVDIVDSGDGGVTPPNGPADWQLAIGSAPPNDHLGVHMHISGRNGGFAAAPAALSPTGNLSDPDRRLRRQIANCNERRRMQSINAGFQSLRNLLPRREGEKLSKAAILQQTADLIQSLQSERARLLEERDGGQWKRRRMDEEYHTEESSRSMIEQLQSALEQERNLRVIYESQMHQMRQLQVNTQVSQVGTPSVQPLLSREDTVKLVYEVKEDPTAPLPFAPEPTLSDLNRPAAHLPLLSLAVHNSHHGAVSVCATSSPEASVSVIRPTPTTPGGCVESALPPSRAASSAPSLAVSPTVTSSAASVPLQFAQLQQSLAAAAMAAATQHVPHSPTPPHQLTPPTSASLQTHRSLNVILDAIRHLEGGGFQTTPPSTPTSHANLMVR